MPDYIPTSLKYDSLILFLYSAAWKYTLRSNKHAAKRRPVNVDFLHLRHYKTNHASSDPQILHFIEETFDYRRTRN